MIAEIVVWLYIMIVVVLGVYGAFAWWTLWLIVRYNSRSGDTVNRVPTMWPTVTIQLPVFNEKDVVERLVAHVAALDYPPTKLHIQLLDDSDDETAVITRNLVQQHQTNGITITHHHRTERTGYKAGALHAGTNQCDSDLIAIFDADFCPQPDFLRQIVPYFTDDPTLGFVQARWGHRNRDESVLTAAQAIALDEHFMMGQTVRDLHEMLPRFNGSAGVWRRSCIEDDNVGGWEAETVCEDMCLSTRAGLGGWSFRFAADVVVPADLPTTMAAFKNQQARWAKGALQCVGRYARLILASPLYTLPSKLHTLVSMSRYCANLLFMLLFLLQWPLMLTDKEPPTWLIVCGLLGIGQLLLLIVPQMQDGRSPLSTLYSLLYLIILAIGISPSQTRAMLGVIWGWLGGRSAHPFIRTPKGSSYVLPFDWIVIVEGVCAAVSIAGIVGAIMLGQVGVVPFWGMCAVGFTAVAWTTVRRKTKCK